MLEFPRQRRPAPRQRHGEPRWHRAGNVLSLLGTQLHHPLGGRVASALLEAYHQRLAPGFSASLSYTATDAILNWSRRSAAPARPRWRSHRLTEPGRRSRRNQQLLQQRRTLPPGFLGLSTSPAPTSETRSPCCRANRRPQRTGCVQVMDQFPRSCSIVRRGRSGGAGPGGPAFGFAPERERCRDHRERLCQVMPPARTRRRRKASSSAGRSGGGFGGTNRTTAIRVSAHDLAARDVACRRV